jgi:hypothetical protein
MKKFIILMLMFSTCMLSQESLTVRYDYVVKSEDGVKVSENPTNLIVIYNYMDSGDLLLIDSEGKKSRLYITKLLKKDKNSDDQQFNLYDAIYSDLGVECFVQIFPKDLVLRLIFKNPVISLTFFKED